MDFLKDFEKATKKMDGVSSSSQPPAYWISTGSYIMNKVMSGKYTRGIPQGRLAMLAGPSGAGKSFSVGNIMRSAQEQDMGILVLDSENALDDDFVRGVGVNPDDPYYVYKGVQTISHCTQIISSFLSSYRKSAETKKFLIIIDSLDALMTDSGVKAYNEGETKGDQGQHAKQSKAMLVPFMHDIKDLNVSILATKQVYQEQDAMLQKNPATAWKLTESIRYPFSQICLVTKLMLKDDATKLYEGIRLKVFGFKTRFTKPFQQAMIEVPYDSGMNPYTGILEAAVSKGIVSKNAAWYTYKDNKFQVSKFPEYQEQIFNDLVEMENSDSSQVIDVALGDDMIEIMDS